MLGAGSRWALARTSTPRRDIDDLYASLDNTSALRCQTKQDKTKKLPTKHLSPCHLSFKMRVDLRVLHVQICRLSQTKR